MHAPPELPPALPSSVGRGLEQDHDQIRGYIDARRRFLTKRAVRCTLAVVLAVAFALAVADVFLGFPAALRWIALAALTFAAAALLARWWWRPVQSLDAAAAVRELEHGFPELGQRLRTAREVEQPGAAQRVIPELARALLAETRRRMEALDPLKLIPWEKLRASLIACAGAVALFAVALAGWPDFRSALLRLVAPGAEISFTKVTIETAPTHFLDRESPRIVARLSGRPAKEATLFTREEGADWKPVKMAKADATGRFDAVLTDRSKSFEFYVRAGDGRSAQQTIRCLVTPKIVKASATVAYPEYTGLGEQRLEGGDVRAVEGSKTRVVFQLNQPLTEARARGANGLELPLTVSGSEVVLEQTLARGEVLYQLSGRDGEGVDLAPVTYKLVGVEDKIPEVKLVEPAKDFEATTVWEVLSRVQARDDFGLAELGIVLVAGDETKLLSRREIAEKDLRTAGEMGTALLEEFPLSINDNLKLYAYARDHKPREGARSVSNLRAIDIRQFRTRWRFFAGENAALPMNATQLGKLNGLITEQRQVVSDVFVLKENGVPAESDPGKLCASLRDREEKLAARALELKDAVEQAGNMNPDDLALLDIAAEQMGEAAGHLDARLLPPAYTQADRALSSLLALRKLVMKILSRQKSACPCENPEDEEKTKALTDLAKEAERLAAEERAVRDTISPRLPPERDLQVTRQRQEVAVSDAGELFASLVSHAEATELVLRGAETAEKEMQKAEGTLRGAHPDAAAPELEFAEEHLLALAAQLRALDQKNLPETLARLAQQAADAKAKLEEEKKKREEEPPGQAASRAKTSGGSSSAAEGGQGEAKAEEAQMQAKAEASGDAQSKERGQKEKAATGVSNHELDKIARQSERLDDILKSLAQRKGAGASGERLAELREQAGTGTLSPDVRALEREPENAKAAEGAQHLAERFGTLAEGLSREQRRLLQSRIESLAAALARTKDLRQMAANDGPQTPPENSSRAGKRANAGDKESAAANSRGNSQRETAERDAGGARKTPRQSGGGLGAEDPNATYLKDLESLDDDLLRGLVKPLEEDLQRGGFDVAHLEPVESRLSQVIDSLLRANLAGKRSERIPDQYARMVQEYFRALSEDFGGEQWNPEEK